jgi:hypothetical protein
MSMIQVNLLHIALVGPLLIGIGRTAPVTPDWMFHALGTLAAMLPFVVRVPDLRKGVTYRNLVNASHYLFWIALFAYVAWKKNVVQLELLQALTWLGVLVIGVHGVLLARRLLK